MSKKKDAVISVCYSVRGGKDNILYGRYACASIASLLVNTTREVDLHILTNRLMADELKHEIAALAEHYGAQVTFHEIKLEPDMLMLPALNVFDAGTLFRLYIEQVIAAEKVIYLDADTIIHLDLATLWDTPVEGKAVMACLDEGFQRGWVDYDLSRAGLAGEKNYFNPGVLVLNLKKIREAYGGLLPHVMRFFAQYLHNQYMDQDALNYIFAQDKKILPQKYNTYIAGERADGRNNIKACIYHSASEMGCIRYLQEDSYDKLFFRYFSMTVWGKNMDRFFQLKLEGKQHQYDLLLTAYRQIYAGKIVFWGSGGQLDDVIRAKFHVNPQNAYYVDNNPAKWGNTWKGLLIHSPDDLQREQEHYTIVVMSKNYRPIKKQLLKLGLSEHKDFFDGRMFLTAAEGGYPAWNVI